MKFYPSVFVIMEIISDHTGEILSGSIGYCLSQHSSVIEKILSYLSILMGIASYSIIALNRKPEIFYVLWC